MQERTSFRLAMLANGYWPVLTDCKQPIEKGWPKHRPDEAEIMSWDRSALLSTGMKLDGDLAVIDADVRDAGLVDTLARTMDEKFPELFARGLVRHAGGPKEAWIARVDAPFKYIGSWCWYPAGSDPADPAVPKHRVECFGSRGTRHFGIDGPHTRRNGEVISTYHFAGGASPATTPRASLPVLPKAAYAAACDLFNEIAAKAGLIAVKKSKGSGAGVVYDLTNAMRFESDGGTYRLDELDTARLAAQHEGRDLRVTSSFLGHGTNPTKCIVGYSPKHRSVCIHDFEEGVTHLPAAFKSRRSDRLADVMKLIADIQNKGV